MAEHAEWQLTTVCANDPQLSAASEAIMAHACDDALPPEGSEAQGLWELCKVPQEKQERPNTLQLNPGPSR